ncbi:LOW QUALITY PROTEIN: putative uncharacterized protein GSN-AS1, partial [Neovison vison]|uniref:LOW QUALITY PROTEIN: putative uncharacterized protein GSN-AS1 n=1 Tax=Neovison vison TaxID=452646 RepID=UPI001CF0AFA4
LIPLPCDSHSSAPPPMVNKPGDWQPQPSFFSPLQSLWGEFLNLQGIHPLTEELTKSLRGKATSLQPHKASGTPSESTVVTAAASTVSSRLLWEARAGFRRIQRYLLCSTYLAGL